MNNRMSLIFMITERCNCDCFFCSRNNIQRDLSDPNLDDVIRAFHILSREYPKSKLIISGGEPTISRSFKSIVSAAVELFPKVEIQTNGTFNEDIADFLMDLMKYNLHVQFSIDGTQSMHDSIRGKGVFRKVMDNIMYMQSVYEHLTISATVTKYNKADMFELAKFLNDIKFRRLNISIAQPHNPCNGDFINNIEWNQFVDRILPLCHYRVDISKIFDFGLMDEFIRSGIDWRGVTNCGRGNTHLYIKSNLDVLPCTCLPDCVGNLLSDNMKIIRKRLKEYSRVQLSESSVCYNCIYKPICNGGCPGYSTKVFGKANMGDVRCAVVREWAVQNGFFSNK